MMLLQQEYFFSKQLEIEIFENYCISQLIFFPAVPAISNKILP